MSGVRYRPTPEHVQAYWREFALTKIEDGLPPFSERPDATKFRTSRKTLQPYINHGRWVADCPMDRCNGGVAVWSENPQACCLDCGTIFTEIAWPAEEELNKVLELMPYVPFEEQKNWKPHEQDADTAVEELRKVAMI